uniref:PH_15 domain-containing protein n=1 Tax=Caenorhabditis japonica TaxID=281687 RepID=A0A8R1DX41_CAEJA
MHLEQPFIGQVILLDKVKKMIVKQEKDDAVVKIVAENGAKITMKVTGKEGLQWVSALLRRNFYMVGHYTHNDNRKTTPSKTPNMFLGLQDKTDGTVLTGSRLDNLVPVDGSGKKGSEDRRGFKTARDVGSRRKLAKTYSDQSNDRNTLATTQTFEMDPSHFDNGANLAGKSGSDTDLFHTKNTQTLTNDLETAQGSAEREGRKKDRDGTPANASTPANAD